MIYTNPNISFVYLFFIVISLFSFASKSFAEDFSNINDFFKILSEHDKDMETKVKNAKERGNALRYIAKFENNSATVELNEVDNKHPFYNLAGNDNIISITTQNYSTQPLVIRGRGAGADFTAAGIFADILRITSYLG